MKYKILFFIFITLLFANNGQAVGNVMGYVYDAADARILANTSIQISNASTYTALTNATGGYAINSVPAGVYTMTAGKTGYNTNSFAITLTDNNTLIQNINLVSSNYSAGVINVTNYTTDWLTYTITTDEAGYTIGGNYTMINGTTAHANMTIVKDGSPVYTSNISTSPSGSFSYAGVQSNYLIILDIANTAGKRFSTTQMVVFHRALSTGYTFFPTDFPQWLKDIFVCGIALFCLFFFGMFREDLGTITCFLVILAGYGFGILVLSISTFILLCMMVLVAAGSYIKRKQGGG